MPSFGPASTVKLLQCHPDLQKVLRASILKVDFTIICAQRGRAEQEAAKAGGKSNAHFGQSPHNFSPALGVDVIPYPFQGWEAPSLIHDLKNISDIMITEGERLGVAISWGGDWKSIKDNDHVELTDWRKIAKGLPYAS